MYIKIIKQPSGSWDAKLNIDSTTLYILMRNCRRSLILLRFRLNSNEIKIFLSHCKWGVCSCLLQCSYSIHHQRHCISHQVRDLVSSLCEYFWNTFHGLFDLGIAQVNVQSFLLTNFQYQPISLQFSWLSVEQPIRFRLSVVYTCTSLRISNTIEDNSNVDMPSWYFRFWQWLFLRNVKNILNNT